MPNKLVKLIEKDIKVRISNNMFYNSLFLDILRFPVNNAITDGGVAPPTILLTIVMMSSNLKSLIISRNSKDSRDVNMAD